MWSPPGVTKKLPLAIGVCIRFVVVPNFRVKRMIEQKDAKLAKDQVGHANTTTNTFFFASWRSSVENNLEQPRSCRLLLAPASDLWLPLTFVLSG